MTTSSSRGPREIAGSTVVALMFAFAASATGVLWIYWYYHSAPFVPLQKAIAAEFDGSLPRVDGGQRRMHKNSPRLLWIVLRVAFRPDNGDASFKTSQRIAELAKQHVDLTAYDQINVRLFMGEPEKFLHKQDYKIPVSDGLPGDVSILEEDGTEQRSPNPVNPTPDLTMLTPHQNPRPC